MLKHPTQPLAKSGKSVQTHINFEGSKLTNVKQAQTHTTTVAFCSKLHLSYASSEWGVLLHNKVTQAQTCIAQLVQSLVNIGLLRKQMTFDHFLKLI